MKKLGRSSVLLKFGENIGQSTTWPTDRTTSIPLIRGSQTYLSTNHVQRHFIVESPMRTLYLEFGSQVPGSKIKVRFGSCSTAAAVCRLNPSMRGKVACFNAGKFNCTPRKNVVTRPCDDSSTASLEFLLARREYQPSWRRIVGHLRLNGLKTSVPDLYALVPVRGVTDRRGCRSMQQPFIPIKWSMTNESIIHSTCGVRSSLQNLEAMPMLKKHL